MENFIKIHPSFWAVAIRQFDGWFETMSSARQANNFYIQSIWLNMLRWNRGCVCVCMCVCVCVTALQPKRMNGFWWNFPQMIWQIFVRSIFLRFWNFQTMTSWRPFLHFFVRALSRSQFCSDFLQNWWRGRKLSSAVCYWKSARSVGNFRQYGGPRFRKKIKMAAKNEIFETRQVRCLIRLKLTCWSRIW